MGHCILHKTTTYVDFTTPSFISDKLAFTNKTYNQANFTIVDKHKWVIVCGVGTDNSNRADMNFKYSDATTDFVAGDGICQFKVTCDQLQSSYGGASCFMILKNTPANFTITVRGIYVSWCQYYCFD